MHLITSPGLNERSSGLYNYVFTGCCDVEVSMDIILDPGDADHELDYLYLYCSAGNTLEITEVGGIAYTTTPATSVNVNITPNFVLTQGNQLNFKFKYCPGEAVGNGDTVQIRFGCANHVTQHNFYFDNLMADVTLPAIVNNWIAETSAIFNDCVGQCDVKKDILHLTNNSYYNFPVTATLSTTCGFAFFINGNPIDITSFQLPAGQSVLQISNPGCSVAAPCDFTIDFDFCGTIKSIPITHDLSFCGSGGSGCSIDCRGITITSNPISMPKVTYAPDYSFDPLTSIGNYGLFGTTGITADYPTYQLYQWSPGDTLGYMTATGAGYTPYVFSPTFTAGDDVKLYWLFETKNLVGNDYEIQIDGTIAGLGNITIIPSGSLAANTVYQGTISIPSFVDPALATTSTFFIKIASGTNPGDYLEIGNRRLQLQQVQKPNLLTTANLDCSTLNDYNATAIGDSKTVTFQLYYANEFKDYTRVWFNPWMFDATADFLTKYGNIAITEPQSGWVVDVMASWIGAGQQPMTFASPNNQLNYRCYINLITDHDFEIIFDFFLIQDLKDWVDLYDIDNRRKLVFTENTPLAPYLLNATNSVYLNQKAMGYLIYIYDPNVIVGQIGTPPKPIYCECFIDRKVMFDVRWWNQGLNGGLPEMSNPTFTFTRNTNPVSGLSTINPTDVTFTVFYPNTIDNVIFWLFDENNTDNSIDFYTNYDSSRALIPTITIPGVIDNHLESPSQAVTSLGGGYYSVSCRIGTGVNVGGSYRLGAICYSSTADVVNSFLSDTLAVKSVPDVNDICCPMDVDVHWLDYMTDHTTSCFMPTLKERVRNQMYIDGGNFNDCLISLGMPSGTSWVDYLTTITLDVYQKRDTYPTPTDRTYFIHGSYQSIRNTAVANNWVNNNAELFVSESVGSIYVEWGGRVLWNDTPFNPNRVYVSPMDQWGFKTPTGAALGAAYVNFHNVTYNWADQDVYFEYHFWFDLSPFLFNQTVVLTQINQLHPMNYDSNTNPYGQILDTISVVGYKNGSPNPVFGTFCFDSYDYLEVTIDEVGVLDGKLIATLNYEPFTEYTIKEHESYVSTSGASQLVAVEMYDVDSDFVGGQAKFKIDASQLQPGNYSICAIRLPD